MGLFGNIGGMTAAAMSKRGNNNQQPGGIGNALSAAKRGMSALGMGGVSTNQPKTGMFGSAINTARAAAAARGGQGTVPGGPGGMFRSIMQGRNAANQNQLASTTINPSAFNTGTVSQLFNSNTTNGYVDPVLSGTPGVGTPIVQKKSSPLKQTMDGSVDPLTGQYIDPTMSQDLNPGTVDPMLDQDLTSLPQY